MLGIYSILDLFVVYLILYIIIVFMEFVLYK